MCIRFAWNGQVQQLGRALYFMFFSESIKAEWLGLMIALQMAVGSIHHWALLDVGLARCYLLCGL
jgi:hypothetical protein